MTSPGVTHTGGLLSPMTRSSESTLALSALTKENLKEREIKLSDVMNQIKLSIKPAKLNKYFLHFKQ